MPVLNFVLMAVLSLLPTRERASLAMPETSPFRPVPNVPPQSMVLGASVKATLAGMTLGLAMTALSVYGLGSYGTALFFLTPFAIGVTVAVLLNRAELSTFPRTVGLTALTVLLTGSAMMLFAIEGLVCLLMALPLALALAMAGAAIGYTVTRIGRTNTTHMAACFFVGLPGFAAFEARVANPPVARGRVVGRRRRAPRGRVASCGELHSAATAARVVLSAGHRLPDARTHRRRRCRRRASLRVLDGSLC